MSALYMVLAETVWFVHVAYVVFVVGGQAAILIGALAGWPWVRNLWLRIAHLAAIGIVAFETIIAAPCSLTVLQDYLLMQAGLEPRGFTLNPFAWTPPGFWDMTYLVFAAIVALTFILVPPRLASTARAPARRLVPGSSE